MNQIAELRSKKGTVTLVGYDFSRSLEYLVQQGHIDCCIVSTEDGFSPLGASRQFFSSELGIIEADISRLANWNRFTNSEISLVGLPNQRPTIDFQIYNFHLDRKMSLSSVCYLSLFGN